MNFQDFLPLIPKIVAMPLPAVDSHLKMAPKERMAILKELDYSDRNPRKAAVLMLLYPKEEETHLVLIVRNSYPGVHSDQIAFPGGKFEEEDQNFSSTALRETEEEIGIAPEKVEIIKAFSTLYIPPSNFLVHPFLAIARQELNFILDPKEVANIIELPIGDFMDDRLLHETRMSTSYAKDIIVPAFKIQGHVVWGATAMMLSELKEVLRFVFEKS